MTFRVLWGIDVVVALVFVAFFFIGLQDGSVSSFNIGLWITTLTLLGGVLLGSSWLRTAGFRTWANILAAMVALPGLAFGLFMLALVVFQPSWN